MKCDEGESVIKRKKCTDRGQKKMADGDGGGTETRIDKCHKIRIEYCL